MSERDICKNRHKGNANSFLANIATAGRKHNAKERIYIYLRNHGPHHYEELCARLEMRTATCSARLSELKAERWITPSGIERETTAGCSASCMRACTAEEREALLNPKRGYVERQQELFSQTA